jgi:hypothetical protein
VSWPFAVSSSVEGVYECREDSSDSLVANRSVIVDERVAVIPGSDFDNGQICRSIAPGYECKVAQIIHRYSVSHPQAPQTISLDFNVLGARPIDLSVEMVWSNHYPVDLDLSWNPVASNSTTLHSVELSTADLVFVGDTTFVDAYVAITANSSLQSYTMCLPVRFHGVADLFPEENLPNEVTVDAGQAANFKCQARIEDESSGGLPASSVTVAFLVRSPDSSELTQCLNCSFSMTELTMCREMVDEGSCSGLQFVKSSSNVLTQNLTAHWSEVDMRHSGYEVVCAIAVNGITQWAHTATLTVTPATYTPIIVAATPTFTSTTPSPSENPRESVNNRELVTGVTVGVVLLVIIVITVLCVLGLVVWYRNRHTKVGKIPLSSTDGSEEN